MRFLFAFGDNEAMDVGMGKPYNLTHGNSIPPDPFPCNPCHLFHQLPPEPLLPQRRVLHQLTCAAKDCSYSLHVFRYRYKSFSGRLPVGN